MSQDLIILMSKTIGPNTKAILTYDDSPSHPRRDQDTVATIAAWHLRYTLSDQRTKQTPGEFKLGLWQDAVPGLLDGLECRTGSLDNAGGVVRKRVLETPYPGVIKPLFIYDHSMIALSTRDFRDPFDSGQVGWVYVTPERIRQHDLSPERAERIIEDEVTILQEYINGMVYLVLLQRYGQTVEAQGDIYAVTNEPPDGEPQDYRLVATHGDPSPEILDQALNNMDLTGAELDQTAQATWDNPAN